jgi:CRP-like cAMP-binding protein
VPGADNIIIRTSDPRVLSRASHPKDSIIFEEGQDSSDIFVIESGRCLVYKKINNLVVSLAVLEKGAIFGEMAAFTNNKRSATVKTLEPSVILRVPKANVAKKLSATDPFICALIDILIANLASLNERFVTHSLAYDELLRKLEMYATETPTH